MCQCKVTDCEEVHKIFYFLRIFDGKSVLRCVEIEFSTEVGLFDHFNPRGVKQIKASMAGSDI